MKRKMKEWILFVFVIMALAGCRAEQTAKIIEYDLKKEPVAEEKIISIKGADKLDLCFNLPEAGFLKLIAYDATEYEEYSEVVPEFKVSFLDHQGAVIYDNISITGGYLEKYLFESGEITARIEWENNRKNLESIAVSWVYAKEKEDVTKLELGQIASSSADDNGKACFSVNIEEDGLYKVMCAEACMNESFCSFFIHDENGDRITGEISIDGTEWASRNVFMPQGTYYLTVNDMNAVAVCSVTLVEKYENVQLQAETADSLPIIFGFTENSLRTVQAETAVDGTKQILRVNAIGTGTYYDYEQKFDIEICNQDGVVIEEEKEVEGTCAWNIPEDLEKITVIVVPYENGVVSLTLE